MIARGLWGYCALCATLVRGPAYGGRAGGARVVFCSRCSMKNFSIECWAVYRWMGGRERPPLSIEAAVDDVLAGRRPLEIPPP